MSAPPIFWVTHEVEADVDSVSMSQYSPDHYHHYRVTFYHVTVTRTGNDQAAAPIRLRLDVQD